MLPLTGLVPRAIRAALRRLPLSDYQKTRLWATSLPRPMGRMFEWPYYRGVELAARGVASGYGGVAFPPADGYSLLEFGVANGDSLQVLIHFRDVWAWRLPTLPPITVVGFDTFAGLPARRPTDQGVYYREGDYQSRLDEVQHAVVQKSQGVRLVQGLFSDTLSVERPFLLAHPPIFVSIDCDYYSSTMDVFRELIPHVLPHGALIYFDDVGVNFYSDLTGELRAIKEINAGGLGEGLQLVEYPLHIETGELRHYKQLYRYFNLAEAERHASAEPDRTPEQAPRQPHRSPL